MAAQKTAPTLILVTHHVEEIEPWIRQVMLLKDGQVLAAGGPDEMITSGQMSMLLDYPCSVFRNGAEFLLRVDRR
jgi:iron complex transport system ATP-binding protein